MNDNQFSAMLAIIVPPIIEQISLQTIAIILGALIVLIISLLIWRRNRKAHKNKEE